MNLTIERSTITPRPPQFNSVLAKPVAEPQTPWLKTAASGLKSIWYRKIISPGLIILLVMIPSHSLASGDDIVVYGQRVPTGFYNWTTGMMSMPELGALFNSTSNHYGSLSPLEQMKMQWRQRCGTMVAHLYDDVRKCVTQTKQHLEVMYDVCDARASGRNVDYTVSITLPVVSGISLGGAITWTAPTHNYAHCANQAKNHQEILEEKCINSFHQARLKERTCQGHIGWTSAAGFGK